MPPVDARTVLLALGVVAVLVLGLRTVGQAGGGPGGPGGVPLDAAGPGAGGAPDGALERPAPRRAVVHVAGAVRRPAVYRLREGDRVEDAIAAAGGPTRRADLGGLNLAAPLEDGRQVLVPERVRVVAGGPAAGGPAPAGGPGPPAAPVNLNTATEADLDALDGIGPAMAARIVATREERGGFSSVDDLAEVPGIGPKRLEALRDRVTV